MLEAYKAIGRPEEIIRRLDHPFPEAEDGYAPLPPMTPRDAHAGRRAMFGTRINTKTMETVRAVHA